MGPYQVAYSDLLHVGTTEEEDLEDEDDNDDGFNDAEGDGDVAAAGDE